MGYNLEFNCLLVVPNNDLDLATLVAGKSYTLQKQGERLYPLNIPIEICDKDNYRYYAKVAIRKLTLEKGSTTLEFDVLKIFDQNEADVYTKNFIEA